MVKHLLYKFSSEILMVQIVTMLPDINREKRL